jgi:hypothetical protein
MGISENALQLYTSGYTIEGNSASTVGASVFPRSANQFPISVLFEYIFVGFWNAKLVENTISDSTYQLRIKLSKIT